MKPKRTKITGWIVIIILGLFVAYMMVCNTASAHPVRDAGFYHEHLSTVPPSIIHPTIDGYAAQLDDLIQTDNPAGIDTDTETKTEDWIWKLDDYNPLYQKVKQLEREIQLLGVQLGSVREELYWLRSINRELIKEIYKRNHL